MTKKSLTKPVEESERLLSRERILSAAKREFAERGYQGSRLGSIARKAVVNQALIHYYFDSKERLYQEVLLRLFGVTEMDDLYERFRPWSMGPAERLLAAIYFMVRFHHGGIDPDFNRIIAREIAEGRVTIRSLMSTYIIPRIEAMEAIVSDGVKEGIFETGSTLFTVVNIINLVLSYESGRDNYLGTPLFNRLYGDTAHGEFFDFVVESVFKALRPRGKSLNIPVLPDGLAAMIDTTIMELKQRQKWVELNVKE